ncbi:unnamed protein product, partial [Effrenium voratum]
LGTRRRSCCVAAAWRRPTRPVRMTSRCAFCRFTALQAFWWRRSRLQRWPRRTHQSRPPPRHWDNGSGRCRNPARMGSFAAAWVFCCEDMAFSIYSSRPCQPQLPTTRTRLGPPSCCSAAAP